MQSAFIDDCSEQLVAVLVGHWTDPSKFCSKNIAFTFLSFFCYSSWIRKASQVALVVKNLPANAGDSRDMGGIPGSGRSPGVRNGYQL